MHKVVISIFSLVGTECMQTLLKSNASPGFFLIDCTFTPMFQLVLSGIWFGFCKLGISYSKPWDHKNTNARICFLFNFHISWWNQVVHFYAIRPQDALFLVSHGENLSSKKSMSMLIWSIIFCLMYLIRSVFGICFFIFLCKFVMQCMMLVYKLTHPYFVDALLHKVKPIEIWTI